MSSANKISISSSLGKMSKAGPPVKHNRVEALNKIGLCYDDEISVVPEMWALREVWSYF